MSTDRTGEPTRTGPVVVGYDDQPAGRHALTYAVDLATRLDVILRVVHVIELGDFPVDPDSSSWDVQMHEHERLLADEVHRAVSLPDVQWAYETVRGDPWYALMAEADRFDAWLVVVGQHTHAHAIGTVIGRVLGSGRSATVGSSLVRHSRHPVLVVPSPPGHDAIGRHE
ncbi:universal stress protein [Leekyejoonella antrihumi]|nr:universal stress protein [Leekyejoonella antrihumi]